MGRNRDKTIMEKNVLLTIAYDGSQFYGWQRQKDRPTVQGRLEEVLSKLCRREISLNGTSRTDAGVHALGQRASFKADIGIPVERIPRAVNDALASYEKSYFGTAAMRGIAPIRILEAREMPVDFHARFDAGGKKYVYKLRTADEIDIFQRNYVYHVGSGLDKAAMKEAAECLKGTHDFKSFEASGGTPRETTVRTIFDLELMDGECADADEILELHVTGDGFLYNMVRIITGTLVDVGLGKLEPKQVKEILEAKDRKFAGHTAPPYGLYLAEVYFDHGFSRG
ncbi:MAG: tRNA pseudouridine(38-40) synthase TruA [Bacillota bacterium]|nr:tRNA pseudouridine(38-40) synthase TruA [Bacillota bacterium]